MIEIFIPTKIKNNNLEINTISENFLKVLKGSFWAIFLEKFNSEFFSGIKLFSKKFDENLTILCNWEFWKNYFVDFDIFENKNIKTFWTKIIWKNEISKNIEKIIEDIWEITAILSSKNLLTNSKKEEILTKIKNTFFSLSGIIFLLYSLKEKTEKNIKNLENYSWEIEYEWQAFILKETAITKKIELQANIDKIEWKIKIFLELIWKII